MFRIDGKAGNDTLIGTDLSDTISGFSGSDSLVANLGNDLVFGGAGDDTVFGGGGHDTLSGELGNDSIDGGTGNDQLTGGQGRDTILGGNGDDLILGDGQSYFAPAASSGTTPATLTLTNAADGPVDLFWINTSGTMVKFATLDSGETHTAATFVGHNWMLRDAQGYYLEQINITALSSALTYGPGLDDLIYGGAAADTILAQFGNDTVYGGSGHDLVELGTGDDRFGNGNTDDGNDTVYGDAGHDSIIGAAGDDLIYGGTGDDLLIGGLGADTLTGGDGDDRVALTQDGGGDWITDFDMTMDQGQTADQLDVSDLRNLTGAPVKFADVVVSDTIGDGTGDAILTFPEGESVTLLGVRRDQVESKVQMAALGIPCFAAGTPLLTPTGWRAVEDLTVGDVVQTQSGPAPILWAGARVLAAADLAACPTLRPIHFDIGAIGNHRPLRLSAQHAIALRQVDGSSVLVRARHLAEAGWQGARRAKGVKAVRYHHLLLPQHAVLSACGAAVESLYPGKQALCALPLNQRLQIAAAIGNASSHDAQQIIHLADLSTEYGPRIHPLLPRSAVDLTRLRLLDAPLVQGRAGDSARMQALR